MGTTYLMDTTYLLDFIKESNKIEGIADTDVSRFSSLAKEQLELYESILNLDKLDIGVLSNFVNQISPGHVLREKDGYNVQVGDHIAPAGGMQVRLMLEYLIKNVNEVVVNGTAFSPYEIHHYYEWLHPFTDGNGRSGRLVWLWQMVKIYNYSGKLGFLHYFYYQTLASERSFRIKPKDFFNKIVEPIYFPFTQYGTRS